MVPETFRSTRSSGCSDPCTCSAARRTCWAKEMARKEGLQLEVYSLDKLGEGDVDLRKDHPFMELKEEAEASAFDAGHAGFPCNTFSRARWKTVNCGPCNTSMGSHPNRRRSNSKQMRAPCWHQGPSKSSGPSSRTRGSAGYRKREP